MRKQTPLQNISNTLSPGNNGSLLGSGGCSDGGPNASEGNGEGIGGESCRPEGSKKAKEAAKKQKLRHDALLSQARASCELSSSIMEKFSFLKDHAMVVVFALKDEQGKLSPEGKEYFDLRRARDLALFKQNLLKEATPGTTSQGESAGDEDPSGNGEPILMAPPAPENPPRDYFSEDEDIEITLQQQTVYEYGYEPTWKHERLPAANYSHFAE